MLFSQTRVADNSRHCVGIDGVVPWDGQDSDSVGHHDVFRLTRDLESCFFQRFDRTKMRDARKLPHAYAGMSTTRRSRSPGKFPGYLKACS